MLLFLNKAPGQGSLDANERIKFTAGKLKTKCVLMGPAGDPRYSPRERHLIISTGNYVACFPD